jgi:hypothetical protein
MNKLFALDLSVACARRIKQCLVSSIVAGLMSMCSVAIAAETPDTIEAVWHSQQLQFSYYGTAKFYSCPELVRLVRSILKSVGARKDMIFAQHQCADFASVQSLTITVASPLEATPENLHLVTTTSATQQLVARLHSEALPTVADLERFPASWKTIRLPSTDCKLLSDIREQVLPKLHVSPVRAQGCGISSSIAPERTSTLRAEALLPHAQGA